MRLRPILASAIAVMALATAVSPSRAQDAQAQAMGRALFNEGVVLFNRGDFEAACPKFEASLKQFAGLGTRGKLAECYEKQGRVASAWQAYRDVAQLAARGGDVAREQVASERAKSLESKLAYVNIAVTPANDLPGLVIKRGGRELERAKLGSAEPVDSGGITIEVSAPGRKTFTGRVTAMHGQVVRFEVPLLSLESSAQTTPGGAVTPPPRGGEPPSTVHGDPPSWQTPVGLVLIGAGVVSMGIGGVFGLSASSSYDGAFATGGGCDRATKTCDGPGQTAVDEANSKATFSTVLFGAGGGLIAVGAIVLLTAPSSRPRAVQIAPTTYAGGAGLTVGGAL